MGREVGAELKQEERKELILLSGGHSQQARELGAHLAAYGASLGSLCIVTSQLVLDWPRVRVGERPSHCPRAPGRGMQKASEGPGGELKPHGLSQGQGW